MVIFPARVDFGEVSVGGISPPKTLSFHNSQSHPLQIVKVLITGHAPAAFRALHADSTVAAGANCSIHVTFTPEAKGARFADLTLQFSDGTTAATAQLSGYGR